MSSVLEVFHLCLSVSLSIMVSVVHVIFVDFVMVEAHLPIT